MLTFRNLQQEAQDKIFDDEDYYQKILDKYQKYRKSGLSTSLARKLQKRKRLRKARHHKRRHKQTKYSTYT